MTNTYLLLLSILLFLVGTSFSQKIIFVDNFTTFNLSVWKHELTLSGGGNWEFEWYVNNRTNSYTRNGILYLLPTLTAETIGNANVLNGYTADIWGGSPADLCTGNEFYGCERSSGGGGNILNPIQSARIRTAESFNFQYGRIEIRAKLPKGDWLWPALWLLPRYNSYGEWPASGEIDLVESRGNSASYPAGGVNQIGTTLHWGPFYGQDMYLDTHQTYTLSSGDFSQNFHIFGFYWNQSIMYSYVDNVNNIVLKTDTSSQSFWQRGGWGNNINNPWVGGGINAPFYQQFYIIMNVACGGTNGYFPDGMGGKPWSDTDPHAINSFWNAVNQWYPTWVGENAALQVDYVRVYEV